LRLFRRPDGIARGNQAGTLVDLLWRWSPRKHRAFFAEHHHSRIARIVFVVAAQLASLPFFIAGARLGARGR